MLVVPGTWITTKNIVVFWASNGNVSETQKFDFYNKSIICVCYRCEVLRKMGALMFSPPMFTPSANSTHTVGPSDNQTVVCLVLVTNGPSPKSKVDKLFVHPNNEDLYPKI